MRALRRAASGLAVVAALAACGTTVPLAQQRAAGGLPGGTNGLTAPQVTSGPPLGGSSSTGGNGTGATSTGPSYGATTGPNGPAGGTGSAPSASTQPSGVRPLVPVTKPLTIGLLGITAAGAAAGAAGIGTQQGVSPSQALQAVAASYAKSGVAGRPLKTVFAEIDPSGDYQQQLQVACAKFTQDNHVDVVVSEDAANDQIMQSCLTKARIPRISTAYGTSNAAAFSTYPFSRQVGGANGDRRMATLITRSAAAGVLTKTSRVGVIVEGCPQNQSVYDQTIVPMLKRVGVADTVEQATRCINRFSDAAGASSEISSAVLTFASRRVDKVMLVSNFEGTLLLFFSQAAQSQGYHPKYLLTSDAIVATLQSNFPAAQMANMSGWGWLTASDQTAGNRATTPDQRACVARLAAGGHPPQSNLDYIAAYAACDGFTALVRALQGSGGDSTADRLLAALDAASAALQLTSLVDGKVVLNSSRHDGPARVRQFSYSSSCSCFVYTGLSQEMNP